MIPVGCSRDTLAAVSFLLMLFTSIEVPNNADINEIMECYIPSNLDATFANANSLSGCRGQRFEECFGFKLDVVKSFSVQLFATLRYSI